MALLEVKNVSQRFGGLQALSEYSLSLNSGEIVGLIGPNGAGKTTTFNCITGIHTPTSGDVLLEGKSLRGLRPNRIAAMGLARTFQEMRLWRHMTVIEHVMMARYAKLGYGLLGALFDTPNRQREEQKSAELAHAALKLFGVDEFSNQVVVNLPYGVARRVEMARALATEPKILLLDEPTVGMTPDEMEDMIEVVREVHKRYNLAIFLIEHRLRVVQELCHRVQCLVFGQVIAEGSPSEIQNNPKVVEAYLGEEKVA